MLTDDDTSPSAMLGHWLEVVRRSGLPRNLKLFAILFASYADANGMNIRPGVARLAVEAEIGYSTAKRYLATLRSVGLTEVTKRGSRRLGYSDTYRQILAPDLLDRFARAGVALPDPAEHRANIDNFRAQVKTGLGLTRASPKRSFRARPSEPPPISNTSQEEPTSHPPMAGLVGDVAGTRARGSEDPDDIDGFRPHGLAAPAGQCPQHQAMQVPCQVCHAQAG